MSPLLIGNHIAFVMGYVRSLHYLTIISTLIQPQFLFGLLSVEFQFSSVQSLSRVQLFATPRLQHTRLPCPSPKFAQTHVCRVGDATLPSHSLLFPSPPVFNLSQYQGLYQGVSSSRQVAKVLEFQLQHPSFQ